MIEPKRHLEVKIMRKCDWSDEQIQILIDGYKNHLPISDIALLVNRSESAVKIKASRLKISPPHPKSSLPHKDLTGMKFGKLTVVTRSHRNIYNHEIWLCRCDCGNPEDILVSEYNLINNHTQSCGCISKDNCRKNFKKYNTYDLTKEYGIGYTANDMCFMFDKEDYDKIKDYCWRVNDSGYLQTMDFNTGKMIGFHRLVLGLCDNEKYKHMDVDHINGNPLDNTKSNLRIVTRSQNNMNRSLQTNNTSGVTGVYWNKKKLKWCAQIGLNGSHIHLGYYDNFVDAVESRKLGEERYFKEYSYDNSRGTTNDVEELSNKSTA